MSPDTQRMQTNAIDGKQKHPRIVNTLTIPDRRYQGTSW
jgi:hypothetical protein